MSEMVERLKQAMRDNIDARLPDHIDIDYDGTVIAMLTAAREPTDPMLMAGALGPNVTTIDVWRAMIDEALK